MVISAAHLLKPFTNILLVKVAQIKDENKSMVTIVTMTLFIWTVNFHLLGRSDLGESIVPYSLLYASNWWLSSCASYAHLASSWAPGLCRGNDNSEQEETTEYPFHNLKCNDWTWNLSVLSTCGFPGSSSWCQKSGKIQIRDSLNTVPISYIGVVSNFIVVTSPQLHMSTSIKCTAH